MTKKEAVQILAILKAAYPNFYKDLSAEEAQGTISVWSMQFSDTPAEIVLIALNKHIAVSKFPPSVAEIKEKIMELHWEAYDKAYGLMGGSSQSEEERRFFERIYKETEGYKFKNRLEPDISNLIGKYEFRRLSEGETK